MKTYRDVFAGRDRAALIPFFVLGDPDSETCLAVIRAAVEAGADVLELGIPFSDPIADGPTIQKADIRALQAGMTCPRALDMIRQVRGFTDVPIGLLMYYNLIFHYGPERFYADAAAAGVNSVLVADVSVDDADEVAVPARAAGLDTVFMATPVTSDERLRRVAEASSGFVYTVSLMGVTGSRDALSDAVGPLVGRVRAVSTVPVCVGFGISTPEHAAAVARCGAQGVIIGSRIVQIIEDHLGDGPAAAAAVGDFIGRVRAALT